LTIAVSAVRAPDVIARDDETVRSSTNT